MVDKEDRSSEADFWRHMEYRICQELSGAADRHLRFLWCDGLIPQQYDIERMPPSIQGHAWMVPGQKQELWTFQLLLPHRVQSRAEIAWESLLPEAKLTNWLGLDLAKKHLVIDLPGAETESAAFPKVRC